MEELHRVSIATYGTNAALGSRMSFQLAHALVEHETLDAEEVKKVVKGEPIRTITEVLEEELSKPTASSDPSHSPSPSPR